MKKRKLKELVKSLADRVLALESRPQPKRCDECGGLFLPERRLPVWVVRGTAGVFDSETSNGRYIPTPNSLSYIETPTLCIRCKCEAQVKTG